MGGKTLLRRWQLGWTLLAAIVAVVAALLLTIIQTAQSILVHGRQALRLAEQVVETTGPIWGLADTSAAMAQLEADAAVIADRATAVADALDA